MVETKKKGNRTAMKICFDIAKSHPAGICPRLMESSPVGGTSMTESSEEGPTPQLYVCHLVGCSLTVCVHWRAAEGGVGSWSVCF